jgi:hypothetical protein
MKKNLDRSDLAISAPDVDFGPQSDEPDSVYQRALVGASSIYIVPYVLKLGQFNHVLMLLCLHCVTSLNMKRS